MRHKQKKEKKISKIKTYIKSKLREILGRATKLTFTLNRINYLGFHIPIRARQREQETSKQSLDSKGQYIISVMLNQKLIHPIKSIQRNLPILRCRVVNNKNLPSLISLPHIRNLPSIFEEFPLYWSCLHISLHLFLFSLIFQ